MSKAKFEAARELIKEKRYDEARALLNTIDHPTAKEWLGKLDKLSPAKESTPSLIKYEKQSKRKRRSPLWLVVMAFACLGITILYVATGGPQATANQNSTGTAESIAQAASTDARATEIALTPPPPTSTITETPLPSETPTPSSTPSPAPTVAPIVFDSNTQGMQPVLGPVNLPSGIYRVTVRTDGFFISQLETVSGTCDAGIMGLFNLSSGQAIGGAGAILKSEDCEALFAISNVTKSWTLEFQQIILGQTPIVDRMSFDNNSDGMQPVLGPLKLPSGTYRVKLVTDGFFIAHVEELSGTCDAGFLGLFNLSAGQATSGAEALFKSNNCEALIAISNVTQPWKLTFESVS